MGVRDSRDGCQLRSKPRFEFCTASDKVNVHCTPTPYSGAALLVSPGRLTGSKSVRVKDAGAQPNDTDVILFVASTRTFKRSGRKSMVTKALGGITRCVLGRSAGVTT